MSSTPEPAPGRRKITTRTLRRMKAEGRKIVSLTAYDALTAALLEKAGVEVILVGDSAGMVVAGRRDTLSVTLEEMLLLTRWVAAGVENALLVSDMPFLTYQVNPDEAVRNAGRLLAEGGAEAVKIEGGRSVVPTVQRLVATGIPVMGHLGLTPQSIRSFGGYQLQAVGEAEGRRLRDDARRLQEAGCFAIVLEKIPAPLAAEVSRGLEIPTIGIGAGAGCDGQILVIQDMLGLFTAFKPRFVRRYAELADEVSRAVEHYAADVRAGTFPADTESFSGGED